MIIHENGQPFSKAETIEVMAGIIAIGVFAIGFLVALAFVQPSRIDLGTVQHSPQQCIVETQTGIYEVPCTDQENI